MIPDQMVDIKVSSKTISNLKDNGYADIKMGDTVSIPISLLSKGVRHKIKAICDYCGNEYFPEYYNIVMVRQKTFTSKDCCRFCVQQKREEAIEGLYGTTIGEHLELARQTMREKFTKEHGVDNPNKCKHIREKTEQTCLERYGFACAMKNKDVQKNLEQSNLKKYGVTNPLQDKKIHTKYEETCLERYGYRKILKSPEIRRKATKTLYKNGTTPTSQQQIDLFERVKDMGFEAYLNYPFERYNLDVAVLNSGVKIDIEFDGWYWHQNNEKKDAKRDSVLMDSGWHVIRFLANKDIPTDKQIKDAINNAIKLCHKHQFIDIR